ncbi:pentapeptide repeat-containing protein [Nocardia thraciensis]
MRRGWVAMFSPGWFGRLIPLITALTAVAAVVYSGKALQATESSGQRQHSLAERGQVADRFNKAVEHLGVANSLDVRLGGIYSLEQVARDSPPEQPTVIDVLAAFVRSHARIPDDGQCGPANAPIDIQAAVTVIGRRALDRGPQRPIDLSRVCLIGIDFRGLRFPGAVMTDSILRDSILADVDLSRADLAHADLSSNGGLFVRLFVAPSMSGGHGANLAGADLSTAKLTATPLAGADLRGASLSGADLGWASLSDAKLSAAVLSGATLDKAHLDGADLTDTTYDDRTVWPAGFLPPAAARKCPVMQAC